MAYSVKRGSMDADAASERPSADPEGRPPDRGPIAKVLNGAPEDKSGAKRAIGQAYGVILASVGAFAALEQIVSVRVKGAVAVTLIAGGVLLALLILAIALGALKRRLTKLNIRILWNSAGWLVAAGLFGIMISVAILGIAGRVLSSPTHPGASRQSNPHQSSTISTPPYRVASFSTTPYQPQALAFDRGGKILAVAAKAGEGNGVGRVYLWNVTDRKIITILHPSNSGLDSVAFSPNGSTLAVASTTGEIYLWYMPTRTISAVLTDPQSEGVQSVAFSRSGQTLASADYNGSIYLWNLDTQAVSATLADPGKNGVNCVAFSPDGKAVAAADNDGSTYLWNLATERVIATLTDRGEKPSVDWVAFSPDGKSLAAADNDGSTYLWNLATERVIATLTDRGEKPSVDWVAFSPDGKSLAAADNDGSTYLWNIRTDRITATFADPGKQGINSVAFSPGGAILVTADNDGNVYFWR
jgi:WD40 repeat protein